MLCKNIYVKYIYYYMYVIYKILFFDQSFVGKSIYLIF
jgi:hypothetical protein